MIDFSRCRIPPYDHQKVGVQTLYDATGPGRHASGVFALLDQQGAGKTKQPIDAACFLAEDGVIDTVLVVTPAPVRQVWSKKEIPLHAFVPGPIWTFDARKPKPVGDGPLTWIVTNYEFLRSTLRLQELFRVLDGRRVWLVLDETSYVKSPKAEQTKACLILARHPAILRRTILNGTPMATSPLDYWSQFQILSPDILQQNFFQFRSRYAVMADQYLYRAGKKVSFKKIVQWQRLDELTQRLAPYVLRRMKADCLDLPAKSYTFDAVTLTPETWAVYTAMRKEAVAELRDGATSVAAHTLTKILRLRQITSGFIGGLESDDDHVKVERVIGFEKCTHLVDTLTQALVDDPSPILVWGAFITELAHLAAALCAAGIETVAIVGKDSYPRFNAVRAFGDDAKDRIQRGGPLVSVGTPQTGGLGSTLTAAHRIVYASNDRRRLYREQSEDRIHRPGQTVPCTITDVLAVGPNGESTIDQVVLDAFKAQEDLASITSDGWRQRLMEE